MAGFVGQKSIGIRLRSCYTIRERAGSRTGITSMIHLEDKEKHNEQGALGTSTWHGSVTGDCTTVPGAHAPIRKVRNDQLKSTSRDVQIRQDGDDLVMTHTVKRLAVVNSGGEDS